MQNDLKKGELNTGYVYQLVTEIYWDAVADAMNGVSKHNPWNGIKEPEQWRAYEAGFNYGWARKNLLAQLGG